MLVGCYGLGCMYANSRGGLPSGAAMCSARAELLSKTIQMPCNLRGTFGEPRPCYWVQQLFLFGLSVGQYRYFLNLERGRRD